MQKKISFLTPALLFSAAVLLFSCKKESVEPEMMNTLPPAAVAAPLAPAASYKIIITGMWMSPQHTVPAGNHFTKFVGMIHSVDSYIFHLGAQAGTGVENVAEVGNDVVLQSEIDGYISAGKALGKFAITLPNITGTDSAIVNLTAANSLVSFESMIAPSPDWFAGLDSYNLVQSGNWVNDITVNIKGYDAGTEDGDVFGYNNPATVPQQNIGFLTPLNASVIANSNSYVAAFATARFIKQ